MSNSEIRAVVFDLDGTLADTSGDLILAANTVFRQFGLPILDEMAHRNIAGLGRRAMMKASFGQQCGKGTVISAADQKLIYDGIADAYAKNLCCRTNLFDGVVDCLHRLKSKSIRLGVCTNKFHSLADELIELLGIAHLIDVSIGKGLLPVHKPDPRHLNSVLTKLDVSVSQALFVGDSNVDIQTAKACNVPLLFFTEGYEPKANEAHRFPAFSSYHELLSLISREELGFTGAEHSVCNV